VETAARNRQIIKDALPNLENMGVQEPITGF
jgi:hypothetical protein